MQLSRCFANIPSTQQPVMSSVVSTGTKVWWQEVPRSSVSSCQGHARKVLWVVEVKQFPVRLCWFAGFKEVLSEFPSWFLGEIPWFVFWSWGSLILMGRPRLVNLEDGCLRLGAPSCHCLRKLGCGMVWVWLRFYGCKAAYHGWSTTAGKLVGSHSDLLPLLGLLRELSGKCMIRTEFDHENMVHLPCGKLDMDFFNVYVLLLPWCS